MRRSCTDGLLHVFDLPSGQFRLGEVGRTCGAQNLYYDGSNDDPMRIEHLFSKLESKTSMIFEKIKTAVTEGLDHIDIFEKDIHILFKFINLSHRRSVQYREELNSPYRENDFMFQQPLEASKKRGGTGDPDRFWLNDLLYLLETSHEDLLSDAEKAKETCSADTYRHFTESYALQVWKAANGCEFFLNDRLVDFEGDTKSFLGTEVKETGSQLTSMTTEDLIHLVLPISPEVAIIFCNESRCWESPFAESMHRLKIPYPENSLLKNAPHKDIVNIHVPRQKRGRKTYPATVAWRVSIGTLSRHHHRIITSYSLSHAQSFILVRSRGRFERAKRELDVFNRKRTEIWKSRGVRVDWRYAQQQHHEDVACLTYAQVTGIVDDHMSALKEISNIVNTTREGVKRTKEMALKSWLAVRMMKLFAGIVTSSPKLHGESSSFSTMHPFLKAMFETAYPPKHPDHKDLVAINFGEFFDHGIGEEAFAQLSFEIEKKISDLVCADNAHALFEASKKRFSSPPDSSSHRIDGLGDISTHEAEYYLENPSFKSVVRVAEGFDVLQWMFEERQDILATFIRQMAVPLETMQPRVSRIRLRRV